MDRQGRTVAFNVASHLHLAWRRDWMLDHLDAILATISHPDFHELGPEPGRERFYQQDLDQRRWLRVVVDFNEDPAWVVTAFTQPFDPRR